jgi:hypothetical protein
MKPSETNWTRVDALSDVEIDTSDSPPLDEAFFADAKLRMPEEVSFKPDARRASYSSTSRI